tara:strand:- start:143 stop:373 length:231 start_codon:yes stop_codon:yes gene_type:complete
MPHIYIPELFITQQEYDMVNDNEVPIDAFIANKIRSDDIFVYIQETDCTYKRARNYNWDSNDLSENPDKRSTICDI